MSDRGSDDRRRIVGNTELKREILKTLQRLNGRPCSVAEITNEVLLDLELSLDPAELVMHVFDYRLKQALTILREAGIVSVSGGDEAWLSLAPNYDVLFRQMDARAGDSGKDFAPKITEREHAVKGLGLTPAAPCSDTGGAMERSTPQEITQTTVMDQIAPRELIDPTNGLLIPPDLSLLDPPAPLSERHEQVGFDHTADEFAEDADTQERLEALMGQPEGHPAGDGLGPPARIGDESAQSADSLFSGLRASLERHPRTAAERRLNELLVRMAVSAEEEPLQVVVRYSAERRLFTVSAILPWAKDAWFDLMQLAGSHEWGSVVGIVLENEHLAHVVRRVIPLPFLSRQTLSDIVLEVINEASQALRVVKKYL